MVIFVYRSVGDPDYTAGVFLVGVVIHVVIQIDVYSMGVLVHLINFYAYCNYGFDDIVSWEKLF